MYYCVTHCTMSHIWGSPLNQGGNPYAAYSENFLKSHVIPELLKEAKQLDTYFPEGVKPTIVTDQLDPKTDSLDPKTDSLDLNPSFI